MKSKYLVFGLFISLSVHADDSVTLKSNAGKPAWVWVLRNFNPGKKTANYMARNADVYQVTLPIPANPSFIVLNNDAYDQQLKLVADADRGYLLQKNQNVIYMASSFAQGIGTYAIIVKEGRPASNQITIQDIQLASPIRVSSGDTVLIANNDQNQLYAYNSAIGPDQFTIEDTTLLKAGTEAAGDDLYFAIQDNIWIFPKIDLTTGIVDYIDSKGYLQTNLPLGASTTKMPPSIAYPGFSNLTISQFSSNRSSRLSGKLPATYNFLMRSDMPNQITKDSAQQAIPLWIPKNGKVVISAESRVTQNPSQGKLFIYETSIPDAIAANDGNAVDQLLKQGFDVNTKFQGGKTAAMLAIEQSKPALVQKFITPQLKISIADNASNMTLSYAVVRGDDASVKVLLGVPTIDVNAPAGDGRPPLVAASEGGFAKVVQLLIDAKAKLEAQDKAGRTALFAAASAGKTDVVDALIKAGAQVNARGPGGKTPLIIAAENGQKDVVDLLIKAKADLTAKDDATNTALSVIAVQSPKKTGKPVYGEIGKLLTAAGAQ